MKLSDEIKASFDAVCPDSDRLMETARRKKKSRFSAVAALCACLALCICFGALASAGLFNTRPAGLPNEILPPAVAGDYDRIYNYLSAPLDKVEYKYLDRFTDGTLKEENSSVGDLVDGETDQVLPGQTIAGAPTEPADRYPTLDAPSENEEDKEHSDTNLQYQGVDEADIVKTDGDRIYLLRNGELYIIDTSAQTGSVKRYSVGTTVKEGLKVERSLPFDMYLYENKLYILEKNYSCTYTEKGVDNNEIKKFQSLENMYTEQYNSISEPKIPLEDYLHDQGLYNDMGIPCYYRMERIAQSVSLRVVDVSIGEEPEQIHFAGISGELVSSRMKDGYVYIVTKEKFSDIEKSSPVSFVPSYTDGESVSCVEADSIYIAQDHGSRAYINLLSYDASTTDIKDKLCIVGAGSELYVSESNIYVLDKTRSEWVDSAAMEFISEKYSYITRVAYTDGELELAAQGRVSGFYDDQFSLDEYNGYLRVVTNRNRITQRVEPYSAVDVIGSAFSDTYLEVIEYRGVRFKLSESIDWESDNALFILDMTLSEVSSIKSLAPDEQLKSVRFDKELCYFVTYLEVDPLFCADLSDPLKPVIKSELKIPGYSAYLQSYGEGLLLGFGFDEERFLKLSMFDVSSSSELTELAVYSVKGEYYSAATYNHKAILCDSGKNLIGFAGRNGYHLFSYDESGFVPLAVVDIREQSDTRGVWVEDTLYCLGEKEIVFFDLERLSEIARTELGALEALTLK